MEGMERRSQSISTFSVDGGKSDCVIEAVLSLEPMSKKYDKLKLRRKMKLRNHERSDIIDCPSLKDDEFFVEPHVESSSKDIDPYKTERVALSPHPFSVRSEFDSLRVDQNTVDKVDTIVSPRSVTSDITQRSLQPQSSKVASWDFIKKWDEYSSAQPSTSGASGTKQYGRRNKLRPSPLANNVGTLLENLGHVTADFFIHLCHLTNKAVSYQGPVGVLLIITCLYYCLMYLEVSIANSAEILLEWVWPVVHLLLRSVEKCLRSATGFVQSVDELGESVVCDWSQLWCSQFDLMCHQRCSFTSKTLESLRHS